MALTPLATPPRHPVDDMLDRYTEAARESGDPALIEDAERQHLIRGHRHFDDLVTLMGENRILVRPARPCARVDKRALTGHAPLPALPSADDPEVRARSYAKTIADELRLPRDVWTYRILTLASEFARGVPGTD